MVLEQVLQLVDEFGLVMRDDAKRPGTIPPKTINTQRLQLRDAIAGLTYAGAEHADALRAERDALKAEVERLTALLNTPELHDFSAAVALEAAHQRSRWGSEHDAGKGPEDWFWLLGYLGGKALRAAMTGDWEKAKHHTISSAGALANWHAALLGANTEMRPGVDPVARGFDAFAPTAEGG